MPGKVLIVSPSFPPVNAADSQRVRMSLPYFHEFGWDAHVLAVAPRFVEGCPDPDLLRTVPDQIPVTRVGALSARYSRLVGLGSLGLRAFLPLKASGARLLRDERFDVVYFSTTVFIVMALGPVWKRQFGVPYVLDFQDPWLNDYYRRTGTRPPGGRLKYGMARFLARRYEPRAVRQAAHILAVSPAYPRMLRERYPDLQAERFTVLPFGGAEYDFQVLQNANIRQRVYDPEDGRRHWVYLGRGGPDMAKGLRALFLALRGLRDARQFFDDIRLHFVGTSYVRGPRAAKSVEPLASELGVADLVEEHPERIPFLEGLAVLRDSDAVLVVGSDDPGYTASKVFPCILSGRPLLAILHQASSAVPILEKCRPGSTVPFQSDESATALAARIRPFLEGLLLQSRGAEIAPVGEAFTPHTAREMTRVQCEVFDLVARGRRVNLGRCRDLVSATVVDIPNGGVRR
jgi:hypothetical protein